MRISDWSSDVCSSDLPGLYALNYSTYYNADRLNDRDGDSAVPDFSIDAAASIFRLVYVTKMKVLGASYAVQVVMPVVDLTVHSAIGRAACRVRVCQYV